MATAEPQLLLKASVLVFLFRAMAGARTAAQRDEVGRQVVSLLRDFVAFDSGSILLVRLDEDLRRLRSESAILTQLNEQGPVATSEAIAVPLYANGEFTGGIILRGAEPGILDTLSAVASLASVSIE